jgi:DHA3 family tetracycline resistance protein-like MFS transporter
MAFTLTLVYQVEVAHLKPLELVLVGTVMEFTLFIAEIPTGVVADLYSRRLSVLIGFVAVGAGIVLQGALPHFWWIMAAQVVWSIGFTFTSGASDAWITDEVGDAEVGHVFTRSQQVSLASMALGTVAAGALGIVSLQLPIVVAGFGYVGVAALLALVMTERNFTPSRPHVSESFGQLRSAFQAGLAQARRTPVVRSFLLISLLAGLSSEAFDRLWTAHIVAAFSLPHLAGLTGPALWFAAFALIGLLIGLVSSLAVQKVRPQSVNSLHPAGVMSFLTLVQVGGMIGLALFGNLWLALAALWVQQASLAVATPIQAAWLNRNIDSASRATVLSVNSQFNAIGQVVGGPPLGALAGRTSIPIALVVSSGILAPASILYARLNRLRGGNNAEAPALVHSPAA